MARQHDGYSKRSDPFKLLGESVNEGTEMYKTSRSNNFAWKDETWIPEDHTYRDYPTDLFNGQVYKRREEVPNYRASPIWEFVSWPSIFYFEDPANDMFTLKSDFGDIWWWCETEPCMKEDGIWMINYKTLSYDDSSEDDDEYVGTEFTFLRFPDECWDEIVLIVESAGVKEYIELRNVNSCKGSLAFQPQSKRSDYIWTGDFLILKPYEQAPESYSTFLADFEWFSEFGDLLLPELTDTVVLGGMRVHPSGSYEESHSMENFYGDYNIVVAVTLNFEAPLY